eukprot:c8858_g1_i1.p1 GENE.c8858_g1_i1~~c8858_g1_i1.p1  ORF type:complete len:419 (+),score=29.42 c8858_g1_i1:36-1292(+)
MFLLGLSLFVVAVVVNGASIYDGQKVVRFNIKDEQTRILIESANLDIWERNNNAIDARVSYEEYIAFQSMNFDMEIIVEDVAQFVSSNNVIESKIHKYVGQAEEWFEDFHDFDDIIEWYNNSLSTHPDLVSYGGRLGTTVEGRSIHGYLLQGRADGSRKLYFQAGLHAREWTGPASLAYVYYSLLEGYGTDEDATWILDNFVVAFIPVANPDGYQYTWTGDRLWRKNRRTPPSGSNCYGVDLNRNWDSQGYGEGYGSSSNPCSDTYHGVDAFSEAETAASSNWFNSLGAQSIWGAIDFHAYGNYVLRPYGWPVTATDRENELKEIGDDTEVAIERVYNTRWTSQRSAQLYPAAGGTEDWMFDSTNSNCLAYCFELRGNSFILPPEEIILSGTELWAGLKVWSRGIYSANSKLNKVLSN